MPLVPLTEDEESRGTAVQKECEYYENGSEQIAYLVKVLRAQNLPLSLSQRPKILQHLKDLVLSLLTLIAK